MENTTMMSMKEQVLNMMDAKLQDLKVEWKEAKEIFADIMLDDNADYRCRDSRRLKCTNLGAQVELLQSMMGKVAAMTTDVMLPPMARI